MASEAKIIRAPDYAAYFEEFAVVDGYTMRVLHEDTRIIARRRITAVETRMYESWVLAALHELPQGQYRVQLISPKMISRCSVTIEWNP